VTDECLRLYHNIISIALRLDTTYQGRQKIAEEKKKQQVLVTGDHRLLATGH
jgi:hypothetical protein